MVFEVFCEKGYFVFVLGFEIETFEEFFRMDQDEDVFVENCGGKNVGR